MQDMSTTNRTALDKTIWRPRLIELTRLMDSQWGDEYEVAHSDLKTLVRDVVEASDLTVKRGKAYTTLNGRHLQRIVIERDGVTVRELDVDAGPAAYCKALAILQVS